MRDSRSAEDILILEQLFSEAKKCSQTKLDIDINTPPITIDEEQVL